MPVSTYMHPLHRCISYMIDMIRMLYNMWYIYIYDTYDTCVYHIWRMIRMYRSVYTDMQHPVHSPLIVYRNAASTHSRFLILMHMTSLNIVGSITQVELLVSKWCWKIQKYRMMSMSGSHIGDSLIMNDAPQTKQLIWPPTLSSNCKTCCHCWPYQSCLRVAEPEAGMAAAACACCTVLWLPPAPAHIDVVAAAAALPHVGKAGGAICAPWIWGPDGSAWLRLPEAIICAGAGNPPLPAAQWTNINMLSLIRPHGCPWARRQAGRNWANFNIYISVLHLDNRVRNETCATIHSEFSGFGCGSGGHNVLSDT